MRKLIRFAVSILLPLTVAGSLSAQDSTRADRFTLRDIFALQWAADPQISPDGQHVAFERNTPISNLYLNMLDGLKVDAESFGDSTGRLSGITT